MKCGCRRRAARRRRHQKEIPRARSQQLAELVALGFLNLAAEIGRGHAVGFIANDQIPIAGSFEFSFQLVRSGRHIEAQDQPILLDERVPCNGGFDLIAREEIEMQAEFLGHFLLPLFDKATGRNDQATFKIAPNQKLLDQQPRHDRLARTGIVRQQKPKRLARQHLAVNGRDLVRQCLDLRGAYR